MKEFDFSDAEYDNEINNTIGEEPRSRKRVVLVVAIIMTITLSALAILSGYSLYRNDAPPAIRTVHIESDNFDNHSIAKYGNIITLTFTFSEKIQGTPMVIIQGRTVEVYGEGESFYAKFFVDNQGKEDELVTFSIHDYRDKFYKTGAPVTETTDLSRVTILAFQ